MEWYPSPEMPAFLHYTNLIFWYINPPSLTTSVEYQVVEDTHVLKFPPTVHRLSTRYGFVLSYHRSGFPFRICFLVTLQLACCMLLTARKSPTLSISQKMYWKCSIKVCRALRGCHYGGAQSCPYRRLFVWSAYKLTFGSGQPINWLSPLLPGQPFKLTFAWSAF